MKRIILSFCFVLVFFNVSFTQAFADKEYYLIDSLRLENLSKADLQLVDSCLKVYYKATDDTSKVNAINTIVEISFDFYLWPKYNHWLYEYTTANLKDEISEEERIVLQSCQAGAINNIGFVYGQLGNIEKQIKFYKKALKIFEEIEDLKGISGGLNNIGYVFLNQGKVDLALEYYFKSLKISQKIQDRNEVAVRYNNIATIYHDQGKIEEALEYHFKSLKIKEEIGNHEGAGYSYNNLGYIYLDLNDSLNTFNSFNKGVNYFQKSSSPLGIALAYNSLGVAYEKYKNPYLASIYYNKSLKIYDEIGSTEGKAIAYNNIGGLYKKEKKYDEALNYYFNSLTLFESINQKKYSSKVLHNLGQIYLLKNDLNKANTYALKSKERSDEIGYPSNIMDASELLSKIYEKQGKGIQALEMYKLAINMRDSINNESTQKTSAQQQAKYEYEKQKAVDDVENEKLVAIEKEEKEKQEILTYATAGVLGLTGVFLCFVFNRLQVTKKQKVVIEEQKEVVEVQKREVESQKKEAENQRDIAEEQKLIVEEKNKEITESITYAKRIQEAILPPPRLVKEWLTESFIYYKPKDIVAGDFYWMETVKTKTSSGDKTLVFFAAADCTGHGVPGAMVSVVCANALNRSVKEFELSDPGKVLDKVTELVTEAFEKSDEQIKDGMDIALCALDISAKKVYYSGANNPLYRITTLDQKVEANSKTVANETHQLLEYKATKQAIGHNDHLIAFETIEIQLEPGDAIYLFSDGFPDQFGGVKGKKYKYSTFRKTLLGYFSESMETQKQLLASEFDTWKGNLEQIDDVCVIGVKINGKEKKNFTKRELEVLDLVKEGLPSKLIADKMNISKLTVDTYRKRLLAKTGTHNATELIAYCIEKEIF